MVVTFTNNVCVNLIDVAVAILPPSVGDVLEPNQTTVYNGASDEAIFEGMGVYVWVNNSTVPRGYACMWTDVSPNQATMICQSVAEDDPRRLVVKAKTTGKKGKLPPKRKPAPKRSRPAKAK